MEASFIIPVFNHLDLTKACLESLQQTLPSIEYEIILVNDGSDSATTEGLRSLATGRTRVVESKHNCGYAHANNLGALHAVGEYLFLLNNDLVPLPGWYAPMRRAFRKFKKAGIVGNVQLDAASGRIDHAGAYVDIAAEIAHRAKSNKTLLGLTPSYTQVQLLTAACCAIPRELFLDSGGFDEAFLNGGEDMDLCLRLRRSGRQVIIANRSVVKHHVSATRTGKNLNTEKNSRLLQRRWSKQIAHQAACRWPDIYVRKMRRLTLWGPQRREAALQAIPRYLMLKKGAAPLALKAVEWRMQARERHWSSLIDSLDHEAIRAQDRQRHANPIEDSYEFEGLYSCERRSGVWIRESATLRLPRGSLITSVKVKGRVIEAEPGLPEEKGRIGLAMHLNGCEPEMAFPIPTGEFSIELRNPLHSRPREAGDFACAARSSKEQHLCLPRARTEREASRAKEPARLALALLAPAPQQAPPHRNDSDKRRGSLRLLERSHQST